MARRTYLQLVNETLKKLRASQVTSVSGTRYSDLVGTLVNEAKRYVESAFNWGALRRTTTVSTVVAQQTYSLLNFGESYRITNIRNLTLQRGRLFATSHDRFDSFWPVDLQSIPYYYRINPQFDANGDPQLDLYPLPNAVYSLEVTAIVNQPDLTIDAEQILVPSWPVILGAYALSIRERGEDGGDVVLAQDPQFNNALNDAIAYENDNQAKGHSSDWVVE